MSGLVQLLEMTAWKMDAPQVGSAFHFGAVFIISLIAIIAAWKAAHIGESREQAGKDGKHDSAASYREGDAIRIKILGILGWVMLACEVYKQLFYYCVVNDRTYDWWFFPFQLCSVPMYMCILLPIIDKLSRSRSEDGRTFRNSNDNAGDEHAVGLTPVQWLRESMLTFMCGFTFVSAVAALAWPEDMLRPYMTLTWHGLIWHGILLFISIMIGLSGMADLSLRGFLRSAVLFIVLCLIAILINVAAEPIAAAHPVWLAGGTASYPDMFYISPYHASNQPVVTLVDRMYGRPAAILAYITGIILLAGAVDLIFNAISGRGPGEESDLTSLPAA